MSLDVAKKVLTARTVLDLDTVPGQVQTDVLTAVIPIMVAENQVKPDTDLPAVLAELLAPEIAAGVVGAGAVATPTLAGGEAEIRRSFLRRWRWRGRRCSKAWERSADPRNRLGPGSDGPRAFRRAGGDLPSF